MKNQTPSILLRLFQVCQMNFQRCWTALQLCWAGLLTFLGLNNLAGSLFPKKVWIKQPLSTRRILIRFWPMAAGIIIFFMLVIGLELVLDEPSGVADAPSAPLNNDREDPKKPDEKLAECFKKSGMSRYYCLITKSELLKLFETFAIAIALILYLFDKEERREQVIRENWSLIDGARGSETSGARFQAIQCLYEEKASLRGLDVPNGDLRGINLDGANLTRSNFSGTDFYKASLVGCDLENSYLRKAKFRDVDLSGSSLISSNLKDAKFRGANLSGTQLGRTKMHRADFTGATLIQADLRGASIQSTILRGANLSQSTVRMADFYRVDFRDVILEGCDIGRAKFTECSNMPIELVKSAENWQTARFKNMLHNFNLDRIKEQNFTENINQNSELFRADEDVRKIEDLLERLKTQREWRFSSLEDIRKKVEHEGFFIPPVRDISDLIAHLEDMEEEKREELTYLTNTFIQNTTATLAP
jgi:uncharacterized protein YjbI with pentapeptide repeats